MTGHGDGATKWGMGEKCGVGARTIEEDIFTVIAEGQIEVAC